MMMSYHKQYIISRDDHNAHDDLLDGYRSDNGDYGSMPDSENEHPFSRMSYVLGGQIFVDGTEPVEFRVGQVFKNFQSFA